MIRTPISAQEVTNPLRVQQGAGWSQSLLVDDGGDDALFHLIPMPPGPLRAAASIACSKVQVRIP